MRRLAALALLLASPAAATPLEDRLREQLQSVTTQLRDIQAQQATLEAAKASAEKERDALKANAGEGSASARELAAARAAAAAERSRATATAAEVGKANSKIADLTAKLSAAQAEAGAARAVAAQGSERIAAQAVDIQACTDRNMRLVATGRELIAIYVQRYRDHNFPPLQLSRAKIENEAQAMQDKLNSDQIIPNLPAAQQK